MIIHTKEMLLTPGNSGTNCYGNGKHKDADGNLIECTCDECDYFLECFPQWKKELYGEEL